MKRANLILSASLLFIGGAALADPQKADQSYKDTPDYQSGYSDGCSKATFGSGSDQPRSDRPIAYRAGWVDGFNTCQRGGSMHTAGGKTDNVGGNVPNPNGN